MRTVVAVLFALALAACGHHEPAAAAPPPRPPPVAKKKSRIAPKPLFGFSAHDVPIVAIALSPDAHTLVTAVGSSAPAVTSRRRRCGTFWGANSAAICASRTP